MSTPDEKQPKTPEAELMAERIERAASAFATALLKHPLLLTMIRGQMNAWKIPTIVDGNTDAMIDAVAFHLHMQRQTRPGR